MRKLTMILLIAGLALTVAPTAEASPATCNNDHSLVAPAGCLYRCVVYGGYYVIANIEFFCDLE